MSSLTPYQHGQSILQLHVSIISAVRVQAIQFPPSSPKTMGHLYTMLCLYTTPSVPALPVWKINSIASLYILWAISPGNGVCSGKRYSLLRTLQAQMGHISIGPISHRMNTTR